MFSAYLVDDEVLVLSDMLNSIPWIENNFMVIGSSSKPTTAFDEIVELKPDVVFTDIKMPGKTGLELIRDLKESGVTSEFVVVSAYEKFEYAKELIQLQGFDYLIKPIDENQYEELLKRLYGKLGEKYAERKTPTTPSEDLNSIIKYLNKNICQKHTLQQIAKQFCISPNYICQLFSKHLQTTYSNYLTELRMTRATKLLKSTARPVKEVAALSGYDDYFYFCRVFRTHFRCTPTQYRESL